MCFFIFIIPPPPRSTLFPYTTLFRSEQAYISLLNARAQYTAADLQLKANTESYHIVLEQIRIGAGSTLDQEQYDKDRKSTRLNSSHMSISYAVFCLKKKKKENE